MNNMIVFPMILPVLTAIFLVFIRKHILIQRWISVLVMLANVGLSIVILLHVQAEGIIRLDFGGWEPPFGILFVADSFSMLLVVTTNIVTVICLLYAMFSVGKEFEYMFFYSFVLFLIGGVNASFLTGDLFNLFVSFEVMLLASYALIVFGGKKIQLKKSIPYIAINVVSSWIFLVAIAYVYGTLGTLNLAHLSQIIAEEGQTPILTVISILFLIVFSLKSGLLLYQWLPASYSAPPTAIAALFGALLTKVGIYAMFRIFTLLFYHEPQITHMLIGILAGLTLIGGSIGAIASNDIRYIVSYNVIIAVGFILVGLAIGTNSAIEGSIYYIIHDMIVKALLFLIAGTMISLSGSPKMNRMSGLIRNYPILGWLFFVVMLALAGIPPLSGFIGKVLLGKGAIEAGSYVLLALSFISALFVLYSLLRIFMDCFWGETMLSTEDEPPLRKGILFPLIVLGVLTFALGLAPESIATFVKDGAETLVNPSIYIDAIFDQ